MWEVRRGHERGHFDHGWLNTYHSFSFGNYYDPQRMGFRTLRVINEDWIQPARGFGRHGHRDMEILTYVLEGVVEHQDSLGHVEQLRAGELQRMTAGRGIHHSEYNGSTTDVLHLYQIWIEPREPSLPPDYEQRTFDRQSRLGRFQLVAAADGRQDALRIHQDVNVLLGVTQADQRLHYGLAGHDAWLQVLRGDVIVDSHTLQAGDALAIRQERELNLQGPADSEVMLFEFLS